MLSEPQLYGLHEAFTGAVPDDAVQAIRAETRAWFAASPSYGPDWLMAMDMSADMLAADVVDPPQPFLGLNLDTGTSLLAALFTNAAGAVGASMGSASSGHRAASSGRAAASSAETARSASSGRAKRAADRAVKQEPGEPKEASPPKQATHVKPKEDIKVRPEGSEVKVKSEPEVALLPSREVRKRRRTSARPASKYAVDAASLSKLIKREP